MSDKPTTVYVGFYRMRDPPPGWKNRWLYLNREATTDRKHVEKLARRYQTGYEVIIKEITLP